MTETPEQIPQKKISIRDIVYAEIDDEITTLVDRLRRAPGKEIYLVVPQRALLFQSIVNLRILFKVTEDLEKTIYIVTADRRGRKMAEECGLSFVEKLEGVSHAPRDLTPSLAITPLKKKSSAKPKHAQKIAIAEIIEGTREDKGTLRERFEKKAEALRERAEEINLTSPNKRLWAGLLSAVFVLFLAVIYIALPSATITLEPASNIVQKTVNLIFTDAALNPAEISSGDGRIVPTYSIDTVFEKTMTFNATEKIFTGSRASGWVTVYNATVQPWPLIGNTRFQTDDGLVFRSTGQITVPGGSKAEDSEEITPGELKVRVIADDTDAYSDIIGDRGNIKTDTSLRIPGLSQYNQKLLYAKAAEDFQGGVTDYYTIISENDLKSAKEFALVETETSAKEELAKFVEQKNQTINRDLVLFEDPNSFSREIQEVIVPEELVGTQAQTFEISAKMHVSGIAYDRSILLSILQRELTAAVHPDKTLVDVNTDGVTLSPLEDTRNTRSGKITVVAVIEGVEAWNFDPASTSGQALIDKIKSHIMGKSIVDAENYIRNLREIRTAQISTWPFWTKILPNVSSSIKIELK